MWETVQGIRKDLTPEEIRAAFLAAIIETGVTTDFDFPPRPYQTPDIGADEFWLPGMLTFIYLPLMMMK